MTTDRQQFLSFVAILIAICYLASIAAALAAYGKYSEALGIGGLTTGLVGVLGALARSRTAPQPSGTPADPIATKEIEP